MAQAFFSPYHFPLIPGTRQVMIESGDDYSLSYAEHNDV
jgi:hypothetical protein